MYFFYVGYLRAFDADAFRVVPFQYDSVLEVDFFGYLFYLFKQASARGDTRVCGRTITAGS